ncbi:MAG: exodeoxyribonuclease V subunit beta [Sandaracinaceae bacterium]
MSPLEIPWARPRLVASLDLRRHAIIEASAGTGKTYTLEHLVLELVASGVPIEEILVVTFTDKATREMKQRVRDRLTTARRALPPDDPLAQRLGVALASFDRAAISTIHAFCQRALTEHAFVSGRPFTQERVDGRESFAAALRSALRRGLASSSPTRGAWQSALSAIGGAAPVAELERVLHAWAREPGEVRPVFEPLVAARALLALPTAEGLVELRWREIEASIPSLTTRARVRDALFALAEGLSGGRARLAEATARGDETAVLVDRVWGEVLAWARGTNDPRGGESHIALVRRSLAHEPTLSQALELLHPMIGSPVPYLRRAVLPEVIAAWHEEKETRGALDFDDMLLDLRDALASDPAVRSALRARYRHALVDEFQDTDEVQWEIFRRLFVDPPDPGAPVPAYPRTLVVIGDAKQAIYGFRSADVHAFDAACRDLEAAGGVRARLGESYRSSAAMLEAVHRILLPEGDEPPFFTGLARYEHPLACGVPERRAFDADGSEAPALVVQHLVGTPELRLPLIRRAHADAIAREIERLVGGGLRIADAGASPRAVRLDEIFVLTRSAAEGQDVAQALRRRGVPHAFFKQDGLLRTDEARHVLDVLRAVDARHDRMLTTRALLGPFFGVALRDLPAAHALASDHPAARLLRRWHELAEQGRTAALLRSMLEDSGLSRRELYLHQSERALVNYRHLLELLSELATRRRLHVADLVAELARRIDAAHDPRSGAGDEDVQRLESERDAVQILTMHKSKGLEAEVVFLFGGLGKPPRRTLGPRVLHEPVGERVRRVAWAGSDDALDDATRARLRDEVRHEDERLYYVALTRAKRRLYLPYFGPPPPPAPRREDVAYDPPHLKGPYRVLNERLRALAERGRLGGLAFETIEVTPRARGRSAAVVLPAPEVHALAELPQAPSSELVRAKERFAGFEVTSYTRMKAGREDEGLAELPPAQQLRWSEAREPTLASTNADGPGGAAFGVLVHGVLEDLLRPRPGGAEPPRDLAALRAHPSLTRRAASHGSDETEREACALLVERALCTPLRHALLSLPAGLGSVGRRAVEMPFLFPVPERSHPPFGVVGPGTSELRIERGFVRGVVDLLFEHEGRTFVVDWKTDRLASYAPEALAAHVEESYRVQGALYTLATLRALGITDAHAYDRFGGIFYVFLRGLAEDEGGARNLGVHGFRPAFDEVCAWERMLREQDGLWGYPLPRRRHGWAAEVPEVQP